MMRVPKVIKQSSSIKSWVIHFLIGCIFGLLGWWGVVISFSFFLGIELTQASYRSFSHGYKWNDLYSKPWIIIKYLPAIKGGLIDTLLDLIFPVLGALSVNLLRIFLHNL